MLCIMSVGMSAGMMPNPVWPPTGIPMPVTAVQPSVPVAKPAATQPLPVSSKYEFLIMKLFICVRLFRLCLVGWVLDKQRHLQHSSVCVADINVVPCLFGFFPMKLSEVAGRGLL